MISGVNSLNRLLINAAAVVDDAPCHAEPERKADASWSASRTGPTEAFRCLTASSKLDWRLTTASPVNETVFTLRLHVEGVNDRATPDGSGLRP